MSDEANKAARQQALVEKFRTVSHGRLERLNLAFLELETNPDNAAPAEEARREIHTLKGEAKLVGFAELSSLAHKTEELMLLAQERGFRVGTTVFDTILAAFEALAAGLGAESEGSDLGFDEVGARIDALLSDGGKATPPPEPAPPVDEVTTAKAGADEKSDSAFGRMMELRAADTVAIDAHRVDQLTELVGDLGQDHSRREQFELLLGRLAEAWRQQLEQALDLLTVSGAPSPPGEPLRALLEAQSGTLGELQVALRARREASFEEGLRIGRIEEGLREIRMLPLASLFSGFPRAVRDLARELGKEAELEIRGQRVEVDQRILERLREPLLHLVRNAVDHGIEPPAARRAAGKPEAGRVRLSAAQEGAHVVLSVADDGTGVDPQRVLRKAVDKAILPAAAAEEADEEECLRLLFRPGFSTHEQATEVSGRGVGLDVVRTAIEALGGTIDVANEPGRGLTFRLVVPASLAFERLLLLRQGGIHYAVPATAVERLVRVRAGDVRVAGGCEVLALDGASVPLVPLASILGLTAEADPEDELLSVVVLAHGGRRMGLKVARVIGERALVRKNLDPFLGGQRLVAGAALLEDGQAVFFLSVPQLIAAARSRLGRQEVEKGEPRKRRRRRVLVVDDSDLTRVMLVEILRSHGYRVLEAAHGGEAVDLLSAEVPDLVVLDLDMPVMDGFEVLSALRAAEPTRSLPVIVLTARASEEDKKRSLELGADAYLTKSAFREADLMRTVGRVLA